MFGAYTLPAALQLVKTGITKCKSIGLEQSLARFIVLYTFCVEKGMHVATADSALTVKQLHICGHICELLPIFPSQTAYFSFLLKPPFLSQIMLSIMCQGLVTCCT